MKLKEALRQIERDRPELKGAAKREAIKALRDAEGAEERRESGAPGSSPQQSGHIGVGVLWAWLVFGTGAMLLVCWLVFGSVEQAPWGVATFIGLQAVATLVAIGREYSRGGQSPE
ncbi:hypothetical protein ACFZC3_15505 [Streptomyces sp. NPDC007903]|uniref:hypothetical protein n=1 Tax=Streptomyces sp. NPDC007903 TaxID=3364786 RepID=UPI0036EC4DAF